MKLKSLSLMIGLSIMAAGASSAAFAQVVANDDLNRLEGTNGSAMMRSIDNGESWLALETTDTGVNNNFPGIQSVIVANQLPQVMTTPTWDASQSYGTANTRVRYQGYFWTNQWWANPGEKPGVNSVWLKGEATNLQQNILGTFNFTPWTGDVAQQYQQDQKKSVAEQRKVVGYFPEWGVYDAHNNFTPDKVNPKLVSHLNYGFAVVKNGVVTLHDSEKGPSLMKDLASRMAQSGVKFMISIGGWDNSAEGAFEAATATTAGTERLAQSMVDYMLKWKFDGIDVDWEYPDTESEKNQFTSLIQMLRSKLDAQGLKDDKYYQLSSAVTTNHNNIQYINPEVTAPLLDSVNVMAYDIHGAFDPITGHNAPLYANSKDADQKLNVSSTMQEYVNTWRVPKNKLLMGVPFYGRGWGNVEPTQIIPGLPGLFAQGSATVKGAWDDVGQFTGTNPWYVLKDKLSKGGFTRYWDSESHVPYMYNAATKELLTYDDPQSVREKVDYINQQGFGGAIIWDISGDTPDYELGKLVGKVLDADVNPQFVKSLSIVRGADGYPHMSLTVDKDMYHKQDIVAHLQPLGGQHYYPCTVSKGNAFDCKLTEDANGNLVMDKALNYLKAGDILTIETNDKAKTVLATMTVTADMVNIVKSEDILNISYTKTSYWATKIDIARPAWIGASTISYYINSEYIGSSSTSKSYGAVSRQLTSTKATVTIARDLKAGDVVSVVRTDGITAKSKKLEVLKTLTIK
ncbi:glycosyl hydrolase family 18 protein [Scandinavium sp. TWS1a]|uniref:glycosyl hydrolase family 18 protein n=1 Tax=Scandinavium tedordense TaxID=2926521 RepID=UPI0021652C2A|nr:glycosyl hydrolase family 18 protein [Scandinavium tedordense]MCS2169174.1 glycosyl hydrolase family 18 protein [Scandinavium tedordense]